MVPDDEEGLHLDVEVIKLLDTPEVIFGPVKAAICCANPINAMIVIEL